MRPGGSQVELPPRENLPCTHTPNSQLRAQPLATGCIRLGASSSSGSELAPRRGDEPRARASSLCSSGCSSEATQLRAQVVRRGRGRRRGRVSLAGRVLACVSGIGSGDRPTARKPRGRAGEGHPLDGEGTLTTRGGKSPDLVKMGGEERRSNQLSSQSKKNAEQAPAAIFAPPLPLSYWKSSPFFRRSLCSTLQSGQEEGKG